MLGLNLHKSVASVITENLEKVKSFISNKLFKSRHQLSEEVCNEFGITDPNGKPQTRACTKVLANLEEKGEVLLPLRTFEPSKSNHESSLDFNFELTIPPEEIRNENLSLRLTCSEEERATWNSVAASANSQSVNLVARQLRYFIMSSEHIIGVIGFSSPTINMASREKFIGWKKDLKKALLHHVLRMDIFHLHPSIDKDVVLPTILKILPDIVGNDYLTKWNLSLKIIETYSIEKSIGKYFTNAKWHYLTDKLDDNTSKDQGKGEQKYLSSFLYLYSGNEMWNEFGLTNEGESPIPIESCVDDEEFLKREYADLELGDKRRLNTLIDILSLKINYPSASLLDAIEGKSAISQRVYRLLKVIEEKTEKNPQYLEKIINGNNTQFIRRVRNQSIVVHAGDGVRLNFSEKIKCKGMGVISSNNQTTSTLGLHGHYSLSLTMEGDPLGISRCGFKAYPKRIKGEFVPDNQKKSYMWIENADAIINLAKRTPLTQHVYTADKEADDFNVFKKFYSLNNLSYVIRSHHNRRGIDGKTIEESFQECQPLVKIEVKIPEKSERKNRPAIPARKATLTIYSTRKEFKLSRKLRRSFKSDTIWINYVRAVEETPPANIDEPIDWILATNRPVSTLDEAIECVKIYRLRWRIEECNRVAKTSCNIEKSETIQ